MRVQSDEHIFATGNPSARIHTPCAIAAKARSDSVPGAK